MLYTADEALAYVKQEDVQCVRLAFFDAWGQEKSISILPSQLGRAMDTGICFDAFPMYSIQERLFLFPLPETLQILPWGNTPKMARMYCNVCYGDGAPFPSDGRYILRRAQQAARDMGLSVSIETESTFYLLSSDEGGNPVRQPHDNGRYLDAAPCAGGESFRMEICRMLEKMGIPPLFACHGQGSGQHQIVFDTASPMEAADMVMTLQSAVQAQARLRSLHAFFTPRPLIHQPCNDFCIRLSLGRNGKKWAASFWAGILKHIRDMTAFLHPTHQSYERLAEMGSRWICRTAGTDDEFLHTPDQTANLYIAFGLLLFAGMDGIRRGLSLPDMEKKLPTLPKNLEEAVRLAGISTFLRDVLPGEIIDMYTGAVRRP